MGDVSNWQGLFLKEPSIYTIRIIISHDHKDCFFHFVHGKNFLVDQQSMIHWWEAMMLLTCYVAYVAFMAYNQTIEMLVKNVLNRKRIATSHDLPYIMQVGNANMAFDSILGAAK